MCNMKDIQMTSVEIARLTGKQHKNVLRDIDDKLLPQLDGLKFEPTSIFSCEESTYLDGLNRKQRQYILNKWSVNALMSYYDLEHAMNVMQYVYDLEQTNETIRDIAWEAIEGSNYINQRLGLKLAGIKHPLLFMKFAQKIKNARVEVFDTGYITRKQINRHGDTQWRITQDGFEWLCNNRDRCNDFVERVKAARKAQQAF